MREASKRSSRLDENTDFPWEPPEECASECRSGRGAPYAAGVVA